MKGESLFSRSAITRRGGRILAHIAHFLAEEPRQGRGWTRSLVSRIVAQRGVLGGWHSIVDGSNPGLVHRADTGGEMLQCSRKRWAQITGRA